MSINEDARRLALAIVNFLQTELSSRPDISLQDRDNVEIAIECLQSVYSLNGLTDSARRPLMDMFLQVSNPVSIKDKQTADALKEAGNSKMANQQYQEAEEDYSQAIELDRWNPVYYCNRAGARIRLEQYFEALSDCRTAVLLNPDYAKAYGRMGQAYARMDSHRRAARCFRQALELEPDCEIYRRNLEVAERRAAEDPASMMGPLIQGILSSILGGGAGTTPFVIMSDPHRAEDCESEHAANQEESSADSQAEQTSSGGSEENSTDEDTIHIRVLFGIPITEEEGVSETSPESGDGNSPPGQQMGSENEGDSAEAEHTDSIGNQEEEHQQNDNLEANPKEQKENNDDIGTKPEAQKENSDDIGTKPEAQNESNDAAGPKEQNVKTYDLGPEPEDPKKVVDNSRISNPIQGSESTPMPSTLGLTQFEDGHTSTANGKNKEPSNRNIQDPTKGSHKETNSLPEIAIASDVTRENKQGQTSGFRLGEISNFFKNFGRSSSHSEGNKSDDKNGKDGEKKETDDDSNVPKDKKS